MIYDTAGLRTIKKPHENLKKTTLKRKNHSKPKENHTEKPKKSWQNQKQTKQTKRIELALKQS